MYDFIPYIFTIFIQECGTLSVNISPSSKVINDVTSYTFTLSVATKLTDGTCIIQVTFPTSSGITFSGTVTSTYGTGFKKSLTTTTSSTNIVKLACPSTGTVDSTTYPVYVFTVNDNKFNVLQVNNIQNPSSAMTVSGITVATYASTSSQDSGTGTVVYTAVTLASSKGSVETADATVGAYADFTATLSITNAIPTSGIVYLIFPKWEGASASVRGTMLGQVTSCSASEDISGNSPTCTVTLNSPSTSYDTITVTNAFSSLSSSLASGKTLAITVSDVRNPPTLDVYSDFSIYTADSSGNYIEQCSGLSLYLQNVGALDSSSYVKLISNTGVNAYGTYRFYIKVSDPIPVGGWIRVILPSEVTATSSTITFTSLAMFDSSTVTYSLSGYNLDIKNGITSYISEGEVFLFNLGKIKNPSSAKPTSSFQFYTFDSSDSGIDKMTTGLTVSATVGSMSSVKIYPYNQTGVLEYAEYYRVGFTTANQIDSTTTLTIKFPTASFDVESRTCYISGLSVSTYTCQSYSSDQTINITKFVSSTTSSGTSFWILIYNLYIRNPETSKESSAISIYTTSSGYKIDSDSSSTITADPIAIETASVWASSYTTNIDNVVYYISFVPPGYLISTAVINVTIPSEITISDSTLLKQKCGRDLMSGFNTRRYLNCEFDNARSIQITNGFSLGDSDDPPTVKFSLSGLKNPRSYNATSSFEINIYDNSNSYPLFNITSGVSITMNNTSKMKSVKVSRGSLVNGESTNYTFSLSLNNSFQDGDYLVVNLPTTNTITLNSTTTKCIGISAVLDYNLACTVFNSSKSLKVSLTTRSRRVLYNQRNLAVSYTSVIFNVTNIKNPVSLQSTNTFQILQYNSGGYLIEQLYSGITIQNTNASVLKFSSLTIVPTSSLLNSSTQYTFTFKPNNYVQNMIMYLQLPEQLSVNGTPECEPLNGLDIETYCTYNSTNRTFKILNAFTYLIEPKVIKFMISNITNPTTLDTTSTFKVYTYTSDGYLIDKKESDLVLDFECLLPCKTCLNNQNSKCTTCYTNSSVINLPYFLDNTCIEECPISYYSDSDYICQKCYSDNCLTCKGKYRGQCTSCVSPYNLLNGNCVQFQNSLYFFPFLIYSILWMVAMFVLICYYEKQWYITSSIFGITIAEIILMYFEIYLFFYFGFDTNLAIVIVAIFLNCFCNIGFMIVYITVLRKNQEMQINKQHFKVSHTTIIVLSCFLSNRLFKLIYSNFAEKILISIDAMFDDAKTKKYYMIVSYVSLLPTVLLFCNAAYNIAVSAPLNVTLTIWVDIERIVISIILIALIIIEFTCPKRPQWIERIISKDLYKHLNVGPKSYNEKYNEVASASFFTANENDQSLYQTTAYNTKDAKKAAIKQILSNLKMIRPDQLGTKLQEMLDEEEKWQNGDAGRGGEHKRRASDPAPFSQDNKRSIHYQHYRMKNKDKDLMADTSGILMVHQQSDDDDDNGERKVMTVPLTPTRKEKYNDKANGRRGSQIRYNQDFQEEGLMNSDLLGKSGKRKNDFADQHSFRQMTNSRKDQEVFMSQKGSLSNTMDIQQQLQRLQQEKEELRQLNELLKEQRLQLEKERAEIERMREVGVKSARGDKIDRKQKLEEVDKKTTYTARGRDRGSNYGKGRKDNLDDIRESQSELIDEEKGKLMKRGLAKDRSQVINSRNKLMGKNNSISMKSDKPQVPSNPHRCHGQSPETLHAVYKLRKRESSQGSSINDFGSPSIRNFAKGREFNNNDDDGKSDKSKISSPFRKNNNNIGSQKPKNDTYVKKTGTKVYYSDKSESSVEDLMDETPSNYNIPNGRLDGKSIGFRFGKKKKNGEQNEDNNISQNIFQKKKNSSPPKVSKKFRQDSLEGDFQYNQDSSLNNLDDGFLDNDDNNSTSIAGASFIQSKKRKQNFELQRIQHNISNLSMDRSESVMTQQPRTHHHHHHHNQSITSSLNEEGKFIQVKSKPNGERIKALEVAYLTKLVPGNNKSTSRMIQSNMYTLQNINRVSITQRLNGNQTPDVNSNFTAVGQLQPPQINNFKF